MGCSLPSTQYLPTPTKIAAHTLLLLLNTVPGSVKYSSKIFTSAGYSGQDIQSSEPIIVYLLNNQYATAPPINKNQKHNSESEKKEFEVNSIEYVQKSAELEYLLLQDSSCSS